MSIEFKDRVSTYPNRYLVSLENGTSYYAILERADEPTNPGTPLNAATMNQLAALTDLTALPSKHLWKKHQGDPTTTTVTESTDVQLGAAAKNGGASYGTRYWGNSYFVNADGELVLSAKNEFYLGGLSSPDIRGKYIASSKTGNSIIYHIPDDATFYTDSTSSNLLNYYMASAATKITSNPLLSFVMADAEDAYPDGKVHTDGYWYVYTKRFGDCNGAVDSTAIGNAVNAYLDEHPVTSGVTMSEVNAAIDAKIGNAIGGSY